MKIILRLLGVLISASQLSLAQIQLVNITAPVAGLTSTCITVLNQVVNCDPALAWAGKDARYEADDTITKLCTASCTTALSTYIRRVNGACSGQRYVASDGLSYLAGYYPEVILEQFSTFCLKNSAGQSCHANIRDAFKIDPDNQSMTGTPGPDATCNPCIASVLSTQLEMPIGASDPQTSSIFSAFTSSCQISTLSPKTPASTTFISRPTTTGPVPTCEGTVHTIQAGDTCQSVSLGRGVSTSELLRVNNLEAFCNNFPTSGTLCIPSKKVCKPYQLRTDGSDTCASIGKANNATYAQIVSWNSDFGSYCNNLGRLAANSFIVCVSTPGGAWVHPSPGLEPTTSVPTTTTETFFTLPGTEFASMASPTRTTYYPQATYVPMFANGTLEGCDTYTEGPILLNYSSLESSFACDDVATAYGVSLTDLIEWNPVLQNTTSSLGGGCELDLAQQYCVQRKAIVSEQLTSACVERQIADPGFTCQDYLDWNSVSDLASFVEWNPDVGSGCESFTSGHTYCAAVRHFRPAGTISTCTKWSMANDTNVANDPCGQFERKYGLAHARFVAWNPSVKNDCTGMKMFYDYCVGTPQFPGTGG